MYSDDDYTDTDTESDEYDDVSPKENSSAKAKAKAKAKASGARRKFRVNLNPLQDPRPTTCTVQVLYDLINNGDIDLAPVYQRDVVWPEAKQIGLIDSIFRNFYIPSIILAVNKLDDDLTMRTCIDGKQRLISIQRFMDGSIPFKDPFTGEKLWYRDAGQSKGSRNKKILPSRYRHLFANKQIVCVEYYNIADQDEREVFRRVQLGMALTPAEKFQVINSPRAQFIRELQFDYFKEDGGGLNASALDWDGSRGADFRCLAQAIYTIEKYSASFKTAPTILQLEKWLSDDAPLTPTFQSKIRETFNIFVLLVRNTATKGVFKKPAKVSPVEFVLIVVLIAVWKDKMSPPELSEAIGKMREDVRKYHDDIRMNAKVTKTMLGFMSGLKASKTPSGQSAGAVLRSYSLREKRKRGTINMAVDGGTIDDDNREDEQVAKKVKRSAAAAAAPASTSISSDAAATNIPQTLTSRPSAAMMPAPGATAGEKHSVQSLPQSQTQLARLMLPTVQVTPPRTLDILTGVRAAGAAAADLGKSQTAIGPAKTQSVLNGDGLESPRAPIALPSPSLPSMGLNGGIGVPVSQFQPVSHPPPSPHSYPGQPLPLPPPRFLLSSGNTSAIPISIPPTLSSSNSAESMSSVPPISGREGTETVEGLGNMGIKQGPTALPS